MSKKIKKSFRTSKLVVDKLNLISTETGKSFSQLVVESLCQTYNIETPEEFRSVKMSSDSLKSMVSFLKNTEQLTLEAILDDQELINTYRIELELLEPKIRELIVEAYNEDD